MTILSGTVSSPPPLHAHTDDSICWNDVLSPPPHAHTDDSILEGYSTHRTTHTHTLMNIPTPQPRHTHTHWRLYLLE